MANEFKTFRDFINNIPKIGDRVLVNGGFQGTIVKVHDGQLTGMVDVKLPRGLVTVNISDLR